jgi:glycosyltransferase involved in cell wall biosynthesis
MKICIVNNLYKPYNRGGAETYVEKLYQGFSDLGCEFFVITTKPSVENVSEEKGVFYLRSLYYHLDKFPKFLRFFWHILNIFNFYKYIRVRNILKKEKPDLLISNNLVGLGFLLPRLFKNLKIKHIHVLHDVQLLHPSGLIFLGQEKILDTYFSKIYQKINSFLFSGINYIIAPSNWILEKHQDRGFFLYSKTKIIFNPLDGHDLTRKREINSSINFLYIGQLEKHKGLLSVLEIMNKITKNKKNINFSVVGDGSLFDELKLKYQNENINFFGRLKKEDVYDKIKVSDCLLAPSLCYENSPSVIYEAASFGIDFIYSDLGGASEIGQYFSGISFSPEKKESLEKIIFNYIANRGENFFNNKKVLELSTEKYIKNLLIFSKVNQKNY